MVQLHGLFVTMFVVTVFMAAVASVETATTKIAYKKPIHGKANGIKDKRLKLKAEEARKSGVAPTFKATTTTTTTTAIPEVVEVTTIAAPTEKEIKNAAKEDSLQPTPPKASGEQQPDSVELLMMKKDLKRTAATVDEAVSRSSREEKLKENSSDDVDALNTREDSTADADDEIEEPVLLQLPAPTPTTTTTTTTSTTTTTESNLPVPCTCGVFLTSQIKRGSNEPPQGMPVIVYELDRNFPCNPIGQKQCQTKCLETIVQHLPNSANILCATLNRDCRKERAYLFIKNCHNQWWNTNLAAGREYCCRNGQPYSCPLV